MQKSPQDCWPGLQKMFSPRISQDPANCTVQPVAVCACGPESMRPNSRISQDVRPGARTGDRSHQLQGDSRRLYCRRDDLLFAGMRARSTSDITAASRGDSFASLNRVIYARRAPDARGPRPGRARGFQLHQGDSRRLDNQLFTSMRHDRQATVSVRRSPGPL